MILRKGGLLDPSRWTQRGNQFLQQKNFESVSGPQFILTVDFCFAL